MVESAPGLRQLSSAATQSRLAVLGSPIAHSQSPALHRAAYRVLGLDWQYEFADVIGEQLADFVAKCDDTWRGLSLTMPLKRDILPLLSQIDPLVSHTGSANTVLFTPSEVGTRLAGFNTDVFGIEEAFRHRGHDSLRAVHILGGGATAASAIAAVARLSAASVVVFVRSTARAESLIEVGRQSGVEVVILPFADTAKVPIPDAVISTIPNGAEVHVEFASKTLRSAVLLDVAYHPWPSALASRWRGEIISGLEMLVLQALVQVRIFVAGDPHAVLPDEASVLSAMRSAVGL